MPPHPKGGRPRVGDRAALTGILFVLRRGLPWELLPAEMGCGSGMTCWRRLREWDGAGVWQRRHQLLLDRLGVAGQLDWSRASLEAQRIPAAKGGCIPVPTRPTAASPAPSATCWSTAAARRWRAS